jgi:outer membrane cobalamin receptor
LTGSRIKRTVRRSGRITDGPFNVVVIDRATIEHSGAADLKQLLARQGLGR